MENRTLSRSAKLLVGGTIVVAAALLVWSVGVRRPEQLRGTEPRRGLPARGAELSEELLGRVLPPAPADAIVYDIQHPLRNGRTVEIKKRWLWVPEGARLRFTRGAEGRLHVEVPAGTKLWKDFYLTTSGGLSLLERRVLLKLSDEETRRTMAGNGGWRLYAAHHLPARADGVHGFDAELEIGLMADEARPFFFRADDWLPVQDKGPSTGLTIIDAAGARFPYVFPGKANCAYCHDGAAGYYANPWPEPVLAFGLLPENLTPASFEAILARGWVDAPAELIEEIRRDAVAGQPAIAAEFRNNCASCHNASAQAPARDSALILDPSRPYTDARLVEALSRRSVYMGPEGLRLIVAGHPERSELILRLEGTEGRRRMPPVEGGVPEQDHALTEVVRGWIRGLGAEAAAAIH